MSFYELEEVECNQCHIKFDQEYEDQEFCSKECRRLFEQETRKYKAQTSAEKKLDMQLNRMLKWLDKIAPMPQKPKPDLEEIPQNMRF